jgi:hypothetical protein
MPRPSISWLLDACAEPPDMLYSVSPVGLRVSILASSSCSVMGAHPLQSDTLLCGKPGTGVAGYST